MLHLGHLPDVVPGCLFEAGQKPSGELKEHPSWVALHASPINTCIPWGEHTSVPIFGVRSEKSHSYSRKLSWQLWIYESGAALYLQNFAALRLHDELTAWPRCGVA